MTSHGPKRHRGSIELLSGNDGQALAILSAMRNVLRNGWECCDDVEVFSSTGASVKFNRLMLLLNRDPSKVVVGDDDIADFREHASQAPVYVLVKLRELVHFGVADFSAEVKRIFEAFQLAHALGWSECYDSFCTSVQQRVGTGAVQLSAQSEEKLAGKLQYLYSHYSSHIPRGYFDVHFVRSEADVMPCARAHRLVLAAASPFFRALSNHHPDECPWKVQVSDVSVEIVRAFLDFTYTGKARVAKDKFPSLALQADAWQLPELSAACARGLLEYPEVASMLIAENSALPEPVMIGVAYSLPRVVVADDVSSFIRVISSPTLASHLAMFWATDTYPEGIYSEPQYPDPSQDDTGRRFFRLFGRGKGKYGKWEGKGGKMSGKTMFSYGGGAMGPPGEDRVPLTAQLEEFLSGPCFGEFLESSEALRVPPWSVAMVVESFLLQLTTLHPSHPEYRQGRHMGGMGIKGKAKGPIHNVHCPPEWEQTSHQVAAWLMRWAEAQPAPSSSSDLPKNMTNVNLSPNVQYLIRIKSIVRHAKGRLMGEPLRRAFWISLFTQVLADKTADILELLVRSDEHLDQPPTQPHNRLVESWQKVHPLYEAAFLVAGRIISLPEGEQLQWQGISSRCLLRLLASTEFPGDSDAFDVALTRWLRGGRTIQRAFELAASATVLSELLKFPIPSNSAPALLRHTVPLQQINSGIAAAFSRLASQRAILVRG